MMMQPHETHKSSQDSTETTARLDGVTILLVDDSSDNQLLFHRILVGAGAAVEVARNGIQAVEMNARFKFDVILMDLMMPIMDGYEATRQIRAHGFCKPIIALTAHAAADVEARCRSVGCSHFALKPIGRRELLSAVSAAANSAY